MQLGQTAYIGALRGRRAQQDYVSFYAHLHRVVDRQVGRVVDALGDPGDPASLRSRTVIARFSDHGEMGLSHGGLRQKMFNAYEESIRVPLVVSNPVLFPQGGSSDALVSLVDVVPTLLGLAGASTDATLDGQDLAPVLASFAAGDADALAACGVEFGGLGGDGGGGAAGSLRDHVLFTYDDHQAATATTEAPGQPNRVRAVRTANAKYAVYVDPTGARPTEHELYDLERDPDEARNLVGLRDGRALAASDATAAAAAKELLRLELDRCETHVGSV
jgi:arylsulfatase A-like enzyme